ncbi:hypothetical protein Fcan01_23880 [Folsomia candida]|uniref:SWIM-type domain-containing protein n=1 Tax=Folsomia candida TaxID=158441 RepID=A0A226D922_FOLCA|nr:hypothetical protein Fcan01_23880 [Folsomia candida]
MTAPSTTLFCGFSSINVDNLFRASTLKKGQLLFEGKHVHQVSEQIGHDNTSDITSKCTPQAWTSPLPYNINIRVDENPKILTGSCTCKAGIIGKCKHVAATVALINSDATESCTSKPQGVCDDLLRTLVTSVEQQEGTRAREEFCTEMLIMTKSYYHYYDSEFRSATIPFISLDFLFPFFGGAWAQAGIDCRIKTKTP